MDNFFTLGNKKIALKPETNITVLGVKKNVDVEAVRSTVASKLKSTLRDATIQSMPTKSIVIVTKPLAASEPEHEEMRSAMASDPSVAFVSKAFRDRETGSLLVLTDEINIRFNEGVDAAAIDRIMHSYGLTIISKSDVPRLYLVKVSDANGTKTLDIANKLATLPEVIYAEPKWLVEMKKETLELPTNARYFAKQWHLENTGQGSGILGEDVSALDAWAITQGNPQVVIAILDDGVDTNHPDLKDNLDPHGYNFFDRTSDPNPRYFRIPFDQMSGNDIHGTPCAGVAAAAGKASAGIAYRCKILPIKIFGGDNLVASSDLADGIRYAARYASVLSCSWSCGPSNVVADAVHDIVESGRNGLGCIALFASGNSWENPAHVSFPASLPDAIAVGASTNLGTRAGYSMYGPELEFLAPSNGGSLGILTTDVTVEGRGFNIGRSGSIDERYTQNFGGTSSATPLAAGVAALVLSLNPNLTSNQVLQILRDSCEKIDQANAAYNASGFSTTHGYGRLNAKRALELARSFSAVEEWTKIESIANKPIPDADISGIMDTISVTKAGLIKNIMVGMDIDHTYIGDLRIVLVSPSNKEVTLHEFAGAAQDDLVIEYTTTNSPLSSLVGISAKGIWQVKVADHNSIDTGKLNKWSLSFVLESSLIGENLNSVVIPDNSHAGASSKIQLAGDGKVGKISVSADISHTFVGDLTITLSSPSGKKAVLRERTGGSADNIKETYDEDNTPQLSSIVGEPIAGDWSLTVVDMEDFDKGKLNKWSIVVDRQRQ